MRQDPFEWINAQRDKCRRAGLVRTLRPRPASSPLLDLASNDCPGLARHPDVTGAAAEAARCWGAGATGSRLVTGSTELHAELEAELADFCGFEAALILSSGYAANLAAVTTLADRGALVVSDAANQSGQTRQPGARCHRLGILGQRRRRPAAGTRRRLPNSRRRSARRRRARAGRPRRRRARRTARRRARGGPERGRHRHPVEVPRQPGRRRSGSRKGDRAPGEHGPHLYLRHRPRPGRDGRRPREPATAAPRTGARDPGPAPSPRPSTRCSPTPGSRRSDRTPQWCPYAPLLRERRCGGPSTAGPPGWS